MLLFMFNDSDLSLRRKPHILFRQEIIALSKLVLCVYLFDRACDPKVPHPCYKVYQKHHEDTGSPLVHSYIIHIHRIRHIHIPIDYLM